jgi:parvulin-like peptidyl-prolyl isomerase
VFGARPGDVVGPLPGELGYHLFRVEGFEPAALDEATTAIIEQEIFDAWLAEQLRDARIDLSWPESADGAS